MAEEKPKPSRDGAKSVVHREPRGVSKPRVGNPWRDMQGGTIGAPTMRVRGGAPSGAGVPAWQTDGARGVWYTPSAREPEDTSAETDASSVRRAYGVAMPTDVTVVVQTTVNAPTAPVLRPAASSADNRASLEWVDGDKRARSLREAHTRQATLAAWESAYIRAMLAPVNPEAPSAPRGVIPLSSLDTLPRGPWCAPSGRLSLPSEAPRAAVMVGSGDVNGVTIAAHDPGVSIRRAVSALAPMAHGAIRTGDARRGIETGIVTTTHSKAVHPCAWCDSVACDRARNPVLPCPVYDRAASRGNPLVSAYQRAVEAHKAPKGAYREATAWSESLRTTAVQRLHALDTQGADIDPATCARGIPCAETLRAGIWRTVTAMNPMDYRGFTNDRARTAQRVDHALSCLSDAEFAREAVARIGSTGVSAELRDDAAAIVAAMAPAGVWWAQPLRSYRMTAGVLGAATLALSSALRAARDETMARRNVSRHQTPGRVAPGVDSDARAESVTLVSPVAPPKRTPDAPRAALPSVVATHGPETRRASREYRGDAPLVDTRPGPVTRPGEARTEPPARTPMGAPLDAPMVRPTPDAHPAPSPLDAPVRPARELPLVRLPWYGRAPTSARWIAPLRWRETPRPPRR